MAEIKSTLDLVMEKTKHLTLSREEKEQQKLKEARQRIKGLFQKYKDQILKKEQLSQALEEMQAAGGLNVKDILLRELFNDLALGRDNQAHLILLNEICGMNTAGLASLFDSYSNDIKAATRERVQVLKDALAQKRSISGSAVVPNVEMDKVWQTEVVEIHAKFDQRLNREKKAVK